MNTNDEQQQPSGGEPPRHNPYAQHAQVAAEKARAAAQDALGLARRLVMNPVAGIGEANAGLSAERTWGVAVIFALVAALGLAFAGGMLARVFMAAMLGGFGAMPGMGFDFGDFLKATVSNLVMIVAAGGGVLLLAPILGGRANPASALLVAATAFLPMGIAALAASLFGSVFSGNFAAIVIMLLMLYGICYLVLVLNAGLRQVHDVSERRAAYGTPSVLAFAAFVVWLIASILR